MFPAYFLVMLIDELRVSAQARYAAMIGAALACGLVFVVSIGLAVIGATAAALLGQQELPVRANRAISLLAPVLLTALVITDVAGQRWNDFSWPIVIGLAATAISRLLKAPSLVAVIIGMFVTAGFRFIA